jgi:hypothetical protein
VRHGRLVSQLLIVPIARMLNHMKEREQQNATQSSPDTSLVSNPLTPEEIEALRRDKKSTVEYGLKAFRKLDSEKPK